MTLMTTAAVKKAMIRLFHSDDAERKYAYRDSGTGRRFVVSMFEEGKWFVTEFAPTNRIVEVDAAGYCISGSNSEVIAHVLATVPPNGQVQAIIDLGFDLDSVVFSDGPCIGRAIHLPSIEACAEGIAAALNDNRPFRSWRPASLAEQKQSEAAEAEAKTNYWAWQRQHFAAAQQQQGLFSGCYEQSGEWLAADARKQILAYIEAPDQSTWLTLRNRHILPSATLWAAWCRADAAAPKQGSIGFPDGTTLARAIRHAVATWADTIGTNT